jgi:hypothetical protein
MRTKALLLAAAFAAVGVATSVAQVYSVNAVGYVNVSITPGFNLVSNPLDAGAGNNTVANLFKNLTPAPIAGYRVYVLNEATGSFHPSANWSPIPGTGFGTTGSALLEVKPGVGAFVFNPDNTGTAARTLTFVGEVMQGNLSNPLPFGYSIRANQVPQAGAPNTFGLPGTIGDRVYQFNKTSGGYDTFTFRNPGPNWFPALPSIAVGEAFFMFRATAPGSWDRTFNVNNPS